jgi:Zn-dependent peptidase ImmA (M78 family)
MLEIPEDEFAASIDECSTELLWEAGISRPPVDAIVLAAELGLVVTHNDVLPHRGHFVRLADDCAEGEQGTIVVGAAERPEREQWAIAHEIGESVAHRIFERLGIEFNESLPAGREMAANRLANALLLPRCWFAADGCELDWDLLALKERYATASHELIARRMLEMRPSVVITVCDKGRIFWRRSNVTHRPPKMLREERAVWQESHVSGMPVSATLDAECGIERVRAWPVHEPGWKREIVRSEIAEIS